MLKLKPSNVCPPDKYTWKFPQDGYLAHSYNRNSWYEDIDKHYKDNNYSQPENWKEIADNDLCRRLSGEWCEGGGPHSFVNTRFTLNDFLRGTKVLASFALSGNVVSKDVAEQRGIECSRCPLNVRVPGCSSCTGMANAVAEAKGSLETKYDYLLQSCAICKCSCSAMVWIPAKFLALGMTPAMLQTHKEIDESSGCWKYRECSGFFE